MEVMWACAELINFFLDNTFLNISSDEPLASSTAYIIVSIRLAEQSSFEIVLHCYIHISLPSFEIQCLRLVISRMKKVDLFIEVKAMEKLRSVQHKNI